MHVAPSEIPVDQAERKHVFEGLSSLGQNLPLLCRRQDKLFSASLRTRPLLSIHQDVQALAFNQFHHNIRLRQHRRPVLFPIKARDFILVALGIKIGRAKLCIACVVLQVSCKKSRGLWPIPRIPFIVKPLQRPLGFPVHCKGILLAPICTFMMLEHLDCDLSKGSRAIHSLVNKCQTTLAKLAKITPPPALRFRIIHVRQPCSCKCSCNLFFWF
mmetsp:Transcript_77443/g.250714  ORF Transcript_77443/g.250714 Transcript_77443/m.250714 type:complete len:215 (-) Transcript_77443:582-1226(-)